MTLLKVVLIFVGTVAFSMLFAAVTLFGYGYSFVGN